MNIEGFHCHIYFDNNKDSFSKMLEVRGILMKIEGVHLGKVHGQPIGPHTKPMFSAEIYNIKLFNELVPTLMLNRQGLDVLVHPITGNELLDHTEHALWLGNKVPLDLDKL